MADATYEYYIWDSSDDDEKKLQERIEKALEDAGLEFEFNNFEYN